MHKRFIGILFCLFVFSFFDVASARIIHLWHTIERVSTDSVGNEANGAGILFPPDLSNIATPDLGYVTFSTTASNLVSGDTNGSSDIFVKNRQTGVTEMISWSYTGGSSSGTSNYSVMSSDGRYVAFQSDASNIVAGDTNGVTDIFVRDRQTGITELISTGMSGQANGVSSFPSISADGRYVLFQSSASNLSPLAPSGILSHIYVKDRQSGTIELIDVTTSGVLDNHSSSNNVRAYNISADGRYVIYHSNATNIASGTFASIFNVYKRDRQLGTTEIVSMNNSGVASNKSSQFGIIDGTDRYIVYHGRPDNFFPGNPSNIYQIYLRDTLLGTTELISKNAAGAFGTLDSFEAYITSGGQYVSFYSAAPNLLSGDTNAANDIYMYDRTLGSMERVSMSITGGQLNGASTLAFLTDDGNYAVFGSTAPNAITGDTNAVSDVFIAQRYVVDLSAPTIISPTSGIVIGMQNSGTSIAVSGTGFSGYQINVSLSGATSNTRSGIIDSNGQWSTVFTGLNGGDHSLTVIQTYLTGGGYASDAALTYFSISLSAPTITTPITGYIFNTGDVTISGTGIVGGGISCNYNSGIVVGAVDGMGNWNCEIGGLFDGTYEVDATQSFLGITSSGVKTSFSVDTIAIAPTILSPVSGVNNITLPLTIHGTGEAGDMIYVSIASGTYSTTVAPSGDRSVGPILGLSTNISYTIQAYQTDNAQPTGNVSSIVTTTFSIPYTPPTETPPTTPSSWAGGGLGTSSSWVGPQVPVINTQVPVAPKPVDTLLNPDFDSHSCFSKTDATIVDQHNGVSNAFKQALRFLYTYGLTKYNGTKDYRPLDHLSRQEAARLFSQFATHVLCRTPSKIYNNTFVDLSGADKTLMPYIQQAYELELFKGDPTGKFRPRDVISQNEIIAVMVRLVLHSYLPEPAGDWSKIYRLVSKNALGVTLPKTGRDEVAQYIYSLYHLHYAYSKGGYALQNAATLISTYKK